MNALIPAVPAFLRLRARRGKEDAARLTERYGLSSRVRPAGTLIWIHGASVGESLAALPLVSALLEKPGRQILVTTGTVTSAKMMEERLPARAFHQYVPVDSRSSVRRFLTHWRPDLALFVESELWPNLIVETHARGVPMALVNARLSERSFRGWGRAPGLARRILSCFDLCLAQDEGVANRLTALGASSVQIAGSLKADASVLPVDEAALSAFRAAVRARPLSSCREHPCGRRGSGDAGCGRFAQEWDGCRPSSSRVIRAVRDQALAKAHGAPRRAGALRASPDTQLYVADTMGIGSVYRAAPFAFLGGSLVPHGGQHPLEATRLGTAIVTGPHPHNFEEIFVSLLDAQGDGRVHNAEELSRLVQMLIADPGAAAQLGTRAKSASDCLRGALSATIAAAETLITHART
jgi:3-deoxy-D-manno-octulosonic-acid transferase